MVWADMDGLMPFAPRAPSRTCVPFTTCFPPAAQVRSAPSRFPYASPCRRSARKTAHGNPASWDAARGSPVLGVYRWVAREMCSSICVQEGPTDEQDAPKGETCSRTEQSTRE